MKQDYWTLADWRAYVTQTYSTQSPQARVIEKQIMVHSLDHVLRVQPGQYKAFLDTIKETNQHK